MQLNRNNFAEFFRADYKTVSVTFDENDADATGRPKANTREYTYKVSNTDTVQVGDKLLVCVLNYGYPTYKVVTVRSVNDTPQIDGSASFDYKWIVGPISPMLEQYETNKARDKQLKAAVIKLETALERRMLRTQIKEALAELPENERAELLAVFGADMTPAIEGTTS